MGPCSNRVENAEISTEERTQDGTVSLGLWHAGTLPIVSLTLLSDKFYVNWFINFTGVRKMYPGAKWGYQGLHYSETQGVLDAPT